MGSGFMGLGVWGFGDSGIRDLMFICFISGTVLDDRLPRELPPTTSHELFGNLYFGLNTKSLNPPRPFNGAPLLGNQSYG